MLLAIDVGNTKITFGLFNKGDVPEVKSYVWKKNLSLQEMEDNMRLFVNSNIDSCIISSVVEELTDMVREAVLKNYNVNPLVLNTDIDIGIKIKSEHPEKFGADRIANAYGAKKLYPQRPIIVVDSGTATTFEIIDKNGLFLGGLIMPGLDMQLRSLGENTSKLPALSLNMPTDNLSVITDNTQEAILSGVIVASAQAVQGLIKISEQKLGAKAFVIGTGGNAELINKYLTERKFDIINPVLTLQGLKMIYELNQN